VIGPGVHSTAIVTAGTFSFATATKGLFRVYVDAFPMQNRFFGVLAT